MSKIGKKSEDVIHGRPLKWFSAATALHCTEEDAFYVYLVLTINGARVDYLCLKILFGSNWAIKIELLH